MSTKIERRRMFACRFYMAKIQSSLGYTCSTSTQLRKACCQEHILEMPLMHSGKSNHAEDNISFASFTYIATFGGV
jgi:hypothetical protein